jgi:rhodanese-related sulfurtransferase
MHTPRRIFLELLVLITVTATFGCAAHISRTDLSRRIESGRAPVIVDVRTSWEYENGHIPGALHIPFWSVLCRGNEILLSEGDPVVLYCEHGPRAYIARADFWLHGISVVYLDGHMTTWRKKGFPIETHPDN